MKRNEATEKHSAQQPLAVGGVPFALCAASPQCKGQGKEPGAEVEQACEGQGLKVAQELLRGRR